MIVQVLGYEPKGLPSLELGVAAELTGAWTVIAPADPDAGGELLAATSGLHVYGPHFLQARPEHTLTLRSACSPCCAAVDSLPCPMCGC